MNMYQTISGKWKRPKKQDLTAGTKARVQHVFSIAGPKPEVGYLEGELQIRGKAQVIFVSHHPPGIEFEISSVGQLEIWEDPSAVSSESEASDASASYLSSEPDPSPSEQS